jgi:hypothetical protein
MFTILIEEVTISEKITHFSPFFAGANPGPGEGKLSKVK